MNIKSIIQGVMILFLIIIFYLLGVQINVSVGKVNKIISNSDNNNINFPSFSNPAPSENIEEEEILDTPIGNITDEMINKKEQYPHHNPMMYKKPDRVFLDNISS